MLHLARCIGGSEKRPPPSGSSTVQQPKEDRTLFDKGGAFALCIDNCRLG